MIITYGAVGVVVLKKELGLNAFGIYYTAHLCQCQNVVD